MLSLGIDVGTSSVKVAVFDPQLGRRVASAFHPEKEMQISSPQIGWAEQDPDWWWQAFKLAFTKCCKSSAFNPKNIQSIGISYQMHGLVCLDQHGVPLRSSIIWCDSRAVEIGNRALLNIGTDYARDHLLNSPGNFTAAKLKWVKENQPEVYSKIDKICLPGEYIAYKLTGELNTTISGLSEGIFYDFKSNSISGPLLSYFGFSKAILPDVKPTFSIQGQIKPDLADELQISKEAKVTYRAGDQPNNAFSLNVLHPGEMAATAGTSGVVYSVRDELYIDERQMANSFAHVNYSTADPKIGVLLCINGVGSAYAWINQITQAHAYTEMNTIAHSILPGSEGLRFIPFGNGVERMLQNKDVGSHFLNLDFNRHGRGHLYRSVIEGVAFAFQYGMQGIGADRNGQVVKAGKSNMFLSPLFARLMSTLANVEIQLYNTDGAEGAARGALVGAGESDLREVFLSLVKVEVIEPDRAERNMYMDLFENWKSHLDQLLN